METGDIPPWTFCERPLPGRLVGRLPLKTLGHILQAHFIWILRMYSENVLLWRHKMVQNSDDSRIFFSITESSKRGTTFTPPNPSIVKVVKSKSANLLKIPSERGNFWVAIFKLFLLPPGKKHKGVWITRYYKKVGKITKKI